MNEYGLGAINYEIILMTNELIDHVPDCVLAGVLSPVNLVLAPVIIAVSLQYTKVIFPDLLENIWRIFSY